MSERYKREIEEILRQAGELGSGKGRSGRRQSLLGLVWQHVAQSVGGKAWSVTPGRVMLVAVALFLLAVIAGSFTSGLATPLGFAGLILFIVGYAMFFIRPRQPEKRWRGQPIDYDDSWWSRFRRKRN